MVRRCASVSGRVTGGRRTAITRFGPGGFFPLGARGPGRRWPLENPIKPHLGAAWRGLALPASTSQAQRRIFFTAGVIASNLPDADLLYSSITPPPLGYLLHHRGHTHTLVGLVGQALLIAVVCQLPAIRRQVGGARNRFWALIGVSLLSHLILDSWNSYGVHPFYPFDMRWYYGDAIFIVEPWFWLFLGVAATVNAQGDRVRLALGILLGVSGRSVCLVRRSSAWITCGALSPRCGAGVAREEVVAAEALRRRTRGCCPLRVNDVRTEAGRA